MSVLFDARVITRPNLSGIGLYVQNLLSGLLEQKDIPIYVFVSAWSEVQLPPDITNRIAPPHRLIQARVPNKWLSTIWAYHPWSIPGVEWSTKHEPQLIHSPHLNVFRPTGATRLITVHDLAFLKFPQFLSPTDRLWHRWMAHSARHADFFVANSYTTKQDLLKTWHIPSARIQVIYPGVVDPPTSNSANTNNSLMKSFDIKPEEYLLYLGNLEPRKNILRLVTAFDQLKIQGYDGLKLVLAGQAGYQIEQLNKRISASPFRKDIVLTGYLSRADKSTLLANALALTYVSLYEGFGLPLIEAMATGIPVLAANRAALPEVTGHAAWLVDPESVEAITAGMQALVSDKSLQQKCRLAGLERARQFSWQQATKDHLDLYRILLCRQ